MTVELAPRTGLIGKPLVNGLALPPDLTVDEWRSALDHADMIVESSPWWVADLMAYGEAHFPKEYTQALPTLQEDPHGVKQSRLKQAAWMAQKYPRNQRVAGLSYTHHRVAAKLEPSDRTALLEQALVEKLSTRELMDRVEDVQAKAKAIPADSTPVSTCAADAVWTPDPSDLLPEHRTAMQAAALDADLADPSGFTAGWLAALVHTQQEACFLPGKWRE